MKNIGILRRTPEDNSNMFILKLDMGCIPDGDDRKIFAVIDRNFGTLGTARIKETKNGMAVFELMIPGRQNASVLFAFTEKERNKESPAWGRSNTQCGIFCIELGIMCQDADPETYGYREYNPEYKGTRPSHSTQRESRPIFH